MQNPWYRKRNRSYLSVSVCLMNCRDVCQLCDISSDENKPPRCGQSFPATMVQLWIQYETRGWPCWNPSLNLQEGDSGNSQWDTILWCKDLEGGNAAFQQWLRFPNTCSIVPPNAHWNIKLLKGPKPYEHHVCTSGDVRLLYAKPWISSDSEYVGYWEGIVAERRKERTEMARCEMSWVFLL